MAIAIGMVSGSLLIFATPVAGSLATGRLVAPGQTVEVPSAATNSGSTLTGSSSSPTSSSQEVYFSAAQIAQDLSPSGIWDAALPLDEAKAATVSQVMASDEASGIPAADLYPPNLYEPPAPTSMTGGHIVPTYPYPNAPAPLGLGYYGLENESGTLTGSVFNTTGVEGYFNTGDSLGVESLYFDFGGQQTYGSQLNAVIQNITLLGQGGYQMWSQNVINYDPASSSGQLTFDLNVWNFSSAALTMSANSIIYPTTHTGSTYEAGGSAITVSYPFSFALYMNTTVNYTYSGSGGSCITYGCNEDYFNYSVWNAEGQRVCPTPTTAQPTCGTYDNVIFNSQAPTHHVMIQKGSAEFQANGLEYNPYVNLPLDFEFDFGIGDSSGSMNNLVYADATLGLLYQNATTGQYQSVPAAYNYGSETGEDGEGAYIGWETGSNGQPYATMTTGPTLLEGLWNISTPSGLGAVNYAGVTPGNAFIAYAPGAAVTNQSDYKVAPTFGWFTPHGDIGANTYLSPGTYTVEVLLSDYVEQSQTITVTSGGTTDLSIALVKDTSVGVYTPLWAFSASDLANLSVSGSGTLGSPYIMPSDQPGSMSLVFGDIESYLFPVWLGIYLNSTSAYVEFNPPPSLAITYPAWSILGKVQTYFAPEAADVPYTYQFQMYFYHASNVIVEHAASIGGWFSNEEVGRKYNVYVNDGTNFLFANDYFNVSSEGLEFLDGGSNNYVWGSTFYPWSDAAAFPGIETPSTGLTVSASGNHIFNNAFYTNGTAASSSTYTNFWNATGGYQPATNSITVDGIALSGSILGGTEQGGNYWFNYGAEANPYGVIPYVARASSPTGSAAIGKGGDYAPLATLPSSCALCVPGSGLYHVTFTESGLPPATSWTARIVGVPVYEPIPVTTYHTNPTNTSTTTSVGFWLPNGTYQYTFSTTNKLYVAYGASVTVNGAAVAESASYAPFTYAVTVTETGLVAGTEWSATVNGTANSGSGSVLSFQDTNGTWAYSVAAVSGFTASVASGTVTIAGAAQNLPVTETPWTTGGAAITTLYGVYNTESALQTEFPAVSSSLASFESLVNWAGSVVRGGTSSSANQTLVPYGYWYDLMSVYDQRGDLQYAYPNAFTVQANYSALLSWAGQVVTNVYPDGDSGLLTEYGYYYDLAYVYNSRGDLQAAFPNALTTPSEWNALLIWAGEVATNAFTDSSASTLAPYNYYYVLAFVYNSRGDLQAAYPNALTSGASWAELVAWAQNVVNHKFPDSSYATLLPYAAEYNAL